MASKPLRSKPLSKKQKAINLFAKYGEKDTRSKMLDRFENLGMSRAMASTYYQNIKSGAWS